MKRMRVNINNLENSDVIATSGCSSKATHIYRYDEFSSIGNNTYKFVWNETGKKWDVSEIYVGDYHGGNVVKNQYYIWNDSNSDGTVNNDEITVCNEPHNHLKSIWPPK